MAEAGLVVRGKPAVDLGNLAIDWLKVESIRDHLQPPKQKDQSLPILFAKESTESVRGACVPHVHGILQEILIRVAQVINNPQPAVDPLRQELAELYRRSGVIAPDDQIVHDSWMVRKYCSLIKVKVRLQKVSTVTHQRLTCITVWFQLYRGAHYIYERNGL